MHRTSFRTTFITLLFLAAITRISSAQGRPQIPYGLKVCMDGCYTHQNQNYGIWIFHGTTSGTGRWTQSESHAILTITMFDGKTIKIHDVNPMDSSERGLHGDYEGTIDGNVIEGDYSLTWEKFQTPDHTVHAKFEAEIPNTTCDPTTTTGDARSRGVDALNFEQSKSALECFKIAANNGDMLAEFYLGIMYRDHVGIPEDKAQAFKWLQDAAVHGFYDAQVAMWQAYTIGNITVANADQAGKWFSIASKNPVMEQHREEQQRALEDKQLSYDLAARVLSSIGDTAMNRGLDALGLPQ
jgi:hypothetical protein